MRATDRTDPGDTLTQAGPSLQGRRAQHRCNTVKERQGPLGALPAQKTSMRHVDSQKEGAIQYRLIGLDHSA